MGSFIVVVAVLHYWTGKKEALPDLSRAAFDQTLPEEFTTLPSLCTSKNDAILKKYF